MNIREYTSTGTSAKENVFIFHIRRSREIAIASLTSVALSCYGGISLIFWAFPSWSPRATAAPGSMSVFEEGRKKRE